MLLANRKAGRCWDPDIGNAQTIHKEMDGQLQNHKRCKTAVGTLAEALDCVEGKALTVILFCDSWKLIRSMASSAGLLTWIPKTKEWVYSKMPWTYPSWSWSAVLAAEYWWKRQVCDQASNRMSGRYPDHKSDSMAPWKRVRMSHEVAMIAMM